jgi:hypothetical protein
MTCGIVRSNPEQIISGVRLCTGHSDLKTTMVYFDNLNWLQEGADRFIEF